MCAACVQASRRHLSLEPHHAPQLRTSCGIAAAPPKSGPWCNIAAELWSLESIKHFVQQDVGLAFVPRITVLQELTGGTLVSIPLKELDMPRKMFMVYRKSGYVSDSAQQLIDVISQFKWNDSLPHPVEPVAGGRPVLRAVHHRRMGTAS